MNKTITVSSNNSTKGQTFGQIYSLSFQENIESRVKVLEANKEGAALKDLARIEIVKVLLGRGVNDVEAVKRAKAIVDDLLGD